MTDEHNIEIQTYNKDHKLSEKDKSAIVDFLFDSLGVYGDPQDQIRKAIDYAQCDVQSFGGFIKVIRDGDKILAALVMNETGMSGYIPENILVYVAVDPDCRGKGLGKRILTESLNEAHGAVALHVEPDNPAVNLYKREGFSNKYLEMRHQ